MRKQLACGQSSGLDGGSAMEASGRVVLGPFDKPGDCPCLLNICHEQHSHSGSLGSIPKLGLGNIVGG